ncbi:MAG: hypothetical protein ABI651_21430 [Verrucomicrobiota bacterium]
MGLLELVTRAGVPGVTFLPEENERAITKKLEKLAPKSAALHCGKAIVAYFDWDFPEAKRHALRSIRIDPDYELAHTAYAFMLISWGRSVEARRQLEMARTANPWP